MIVKAINQLKAGDRVACKNGFITVKRVYRMTIFIGDVWCVATDDGNKWSDNGNDEVQVQ